MKAFILECPECKHISNYSDKTFCEKCGTELCTNENSVVRSLYATTQEIKEQEEKLVLLVGRCDRLQKLADSEALMKGMDFPDNPALYDLPYFVLTQRLSSCEPDSLELSKLLETLYNKGKDSAHLIDPLKQILIGTIIDERLDVLAEAILDICPDGVEINYGGEENEDQNSHVRRIFVTEDAHESKLEGEDAKSLVIVLDYFGELEQQKQIQITDNGLLFDEDAFSELQHLCNKYQIDVDKELTNKWRL